MACVYGVHYIHVYFIKNCSYLHTWSFFQTFCCPGATSFYVEFDPRCETERKYDFLEFTDVNGNKCHYDQKVGTGSWPLNVTFKGGHRLHFLFHSDSSNNEWGYKFKASLWLYYVPYYSMLSGTAGEEITE